MKLLILILAIALLACTTTTDGAERYSGGSSGCRQFDRMISDVAQGFMTSDEIHAAARAIQQRTSTAEPDIKAAAADMLRADNAQDVSAFAQAVDAMVAACEENGY